MPAYFTVLRSYISLGNIARRSRTILYRNRFILLRNISSLRLSCTGGFYSKYCTIAETVLTSKAQSTSGSSGELKDVGEQSKQNGNCTNIEHETVQSSQSDSKDLSSSNLGSQSLYVEDKSTATDDDLVDKLHVHAVDTDTTRTLKSRFHLEEDWKTSRGNVPGVKFPGDIYVIKNKEDELKHEGVLQGFLEQKVLGFDTENCPIRQTVCVFQLATHNEAVLWQCSDFNGHVPYYLKEILTGSVSKVGHACLEDAIMISKQFNIEPVNLIDTYCWSKDLHCFPGSLQGLCAIFLQEHISKRHQRSNWRKDNLSVSQINYAATDAWVSLRVYEEMKRHGEELGVALTPMYTTLSQRYQEIKQSRTLKNKRRRQRLRERKNALKEHILETGN